MALEEYFQAQKRGDILFLLCYFYTVMGEKKKAQIALKHLRTLETDSTEVKELIKALEKAFSEAHSDSETSKPSVLPKAKSGEEKLKAEEALDEGKKRFSESDYGKALTLFAQAILENPKNMEPQWLLGLTNLALGAYPQGYKIFKELLLKAEPLPWEKYYKSVKVFSEHLEKLRRFVRDHPQDNEALFVLGVLFLGIQKHQQALPIFITLKQRLPENPEITRGLELAQKLREKK
jgi:tetratricopeptide (TPR) repeat protein